MSLPSVVKDSVIFEKALQGDGECAQVKEIFGWIIRNQDGTLRLPPKRLTELKILLAIHPYLRRMSNQKMEHLIEKLHIIHLAIPGAMGHFYHLQMALTFANHASRAASYLTKSYHMDVKFWQFLCEDMGSWPTYLFEIVQHLATEVGYTDGSGLGCGGVWINPNNNSVQYVWRLPWT